MMHQEQTQIVSRQGFQVGNFAMIVFHDHSDLVLFNHAVQLERNDSLAVERVFFSSIDHFDSVIVVKPSYAFLEIIADKDTNDCIARVDWPIFVEGLVGHLGDQH